MQSGTDQELAPRVPAVVQLDRLLESDRAPKRVSCASEDGDRRSTVHFTDAPFTLRGDSLSQQAHMRVAQLVDDAGVDVPVADQVGAQGGHRGRADRQRIVALALRLESLLAQQPFVQRPQAGTGRHSELRLQQPSDVEDVQGLGYPAALGERFDEEAVARLAVRRRLDQSSGGAFGRREP